MYNPKIVGLGLLLICFQVQGNVIFHKPSTSQLAFTYSKSTVEIPEQCMKSVLS